MSMNTHQIHTVWVKMMTQVEIYNPHGDLIATAHSSWELILAMGPFEQDVGQFSASSSLCM